MWHKAIKTPSNRAEIDLVICCARTTLAPRHAAKLAELARQKVDWTSVLALAHEHAVLSLLQHHLQNHPAIPRHFRQELGHAAMASAQRNLFLTAQLLELLAVLEDRGISAIPFKGPALAARAYGGIGFRRSGDLDLLVRQADIAHAYRALERLGYSGSLPTERALQDLCFAAENQFELRKGDNIYVELHWAVNLGKFRIAIELEEVWQRAKVSSFAGHRFADLSSEDLLVLLCIHGTGHQWSRIGWLTDIAEFIKSADPPVDWTAVQERASRAGAARMVRLGLLLAHDLLEAELPPHVHQWIRSDGVARSLATKLLNRYGRDGTSAQSLLAQIRFHVISRERWRDKILDLCRFAILPNASDCACVTVPARVAFLYFLIRPLRLMAKYGVRAFSRVTASA